MKLFGKKTKDEPEVKAQPPAEVKSAKVVAPKKSTVKVEEKTDEKIAFRPDAHRVLLKPLVSEKATMVNALNKYVFIVSPKANKSEIKKAIKELYGVSPLAVNIINKMGKFVAVRGRFGKTKDMKKAIITLKKGDSIKIYEGI